MGCINGKRIFKGMQGIILIAMIALSWGLSFGSEVSVKENNDNHIPDKKAVSDQATAETGHKVIVFYFHGTVRCHTCNLIEKLTREAVREGFEDEIEKGLIEMKAVNVQDPENSRYITSYRLYTKTVIVSDTIGGKEQRWKNLQRVWELTYNDAAFKKYIQKEVREYLKDKRS